MHALCVPIVRSLSATANSAPSRIKHIVSLAIHTSALRAARLVKIGDPLHVSLKVLPIGNWGRLYWSGRSKDSSNLPQVLHLPYSCWSKAWSLESQEYVMAVTYDRLIHKHSLLLRLRSARTQGLISLLGSIEAWGSLQGMRMLNANAVKAMVTFYYLLLFTPWSLQGKEILVDPFEAEGSKWHRYCFMCEVHF